MVPDRRRRLACKYFYLQSSFGCSVNIYTKDRLIYLWGGGGGGEDFSLNLNSLRRSHVDSLFTDEEQKKGCLVTYFILLPHIPCLFIASLTDYTLLSTKWKNSRPCFVIFKR